MRGGGNKRFNCMSLAQFREKGTSYKKQTGVLIKSLTFKTVAVLTVFERGHGL